MLIGVVGGLALLALIATAILFVRESRSAKAPNPTVSEPSPARAEPSPASKPLAASAPQALPEPSRPIARQTRPSKPARPLFRGTIWPPEVHSARIVDPATETEPGAEKEAETAPEKDTEPALSTDNPAPDAEASEEPAVQQSGGRLRRVFGSILKPFRNKKPVSPTP